MSSPCISVQEVGVQSLHIYKEVRTLLNHVLIIVLGFTSLIQLGVIIIYKADTFTELAYFYFKSFLLSTHTYVFTSSKFLNSPSLPPIPIRLIGHINIDVFYIQKLLFFLFARALVDVIGFPFHIYQSIFLNKNNHFDVYPFYFQS